MSNGNGKSFWTSMPGILTGIATLLTAAAAVYPFVNDSDGDRKTAATTTPSPSVTAESTTLPSDEYGSSPYGTSSTSAAPKILVTPKKLEFGKRGVGSGGDALGFTLANAGGGELTIEDVTLEGPNKDAFAVSAASCDNSTLGPAEDCDATVTFDPSGVGTLVGEVVIEHSGNTSPERVPLTGTGSVL